jgi:hypothetical protein
LSKFAPKWSAATPKAVIKKNEKENCSFMKAKAEPIMTGTKDPDRKGALSAFKYTFMVTMAWY